MSAPANPSVPLKRNFAQEKERKRIALGRVVWQQMRLDAEIARSTALAWSSHAQGNGKHLDHAVDVALAKDKHEALEIERLELTRDLKSYLEYDP